MRLSMSLIVDQVAAHRSSNPLLADHVFSVSPEDQVVLGERRKGIGHRLLCGFVPLETHTLKDFAPAKTGRMFPDDP